MVFSGLMAHVLKSTAYFDKPATLTELAKLASGGNNSTENAAPVVYAPTGLKPKRPPANATVNI